MFSKIKIYQRVILIGLGISAGCGGFVKKLMAGFFNQGEITMKSFFKIVLAFIAMGALSNTAQATLIELMIVAGRNYSVTTAANPVAGGNISCNPNLVSYGKNSVCTATANAGYTFNNFSGDCTGTSCTLNNVTSAKTVTANFTQNPFAVTLNKSGNGTITGNGNYAVGATVNLAATPDANYIFTGWSPSPCANSFVMPNNALTCTANFTQNTFAVTLNKTGNGTITGNGNYAVGSTVNLSALPAKYWSFLGWSPSPCSSSFIMPSNDLTCTASFKQNTYALTLNKTGTGLGIVNGGGNYTAGATINLTATPDANSTFTGWSPSPCANSFVISENALTCTANFTLKNYPITSAANPIAGGSVSCNPNPVNHGSNSVCTAIPNAGYTFTDFSSDCTGTSCTLNNVSSAKTVNANFVLKNYSITTQNSNGKIEPPSLQLEHGKTAQFSLIPDAGYELDTVQGCGAGVISPQRNSYAIPVISNDCQISAIFKRKAYPVTFSVNPTNAGIIGISSPITIKHGESSIFTITPSSGYEIGGVSGCNAGLQSGNTYTTGIITDTCNISVNFITKGQISITTKTNGNGSIDPLGKSLDKGNSAVFTLIPKTGYEIDSVSGCNGSRNIENNTFITDKLNDNCEITAYFKPKLYTVSTKVSTDKGGSIDPIFSQVEYGKNVKFTIIPATGYEIDRVEGCSGHFQDNQFTTGLIETNCEVIAYFKLKQWTVTSSISGIGGEIKPISQSIQHGQTAELNLVPESGYEVNEVTGTCNGSRKDNVYTTNAVTTNCSVIASFKVKGYSIQSSIRPSGAGFIKPTLNSVEYGKTVDFSVISNDGYSIDRVQGCNGESIVPINGIYTTRPITDNCTLSADFISKKYEIKLISQYTNKSSESISLGSIEHGQVKIFPLPVVDGEKVESIIGCNGRLEGDNYTTGQIVGNCEITIFFQPTTSQCSIFDIFAHPQAFVPCVKVGNDVYEAGMNMISASPTMRFEVDMNTLKSIHLIPNKQCAVFPLLNTNHLRLNCLNTASEKYWVEMSLVDNPNVIQFDLSNYGLLNSQQ